MMNSIYNYNRLNKNSYINFGAKDKDNLSDPFAHLNRSKIKKTKQKTKSAVNVVGDGVTSAADTVGTGIKKGKTAVQNMGSGISGFFKKTFSTNKKTDDKKTVNKTPAQKPQIPNKPAQPVQSTEETIKKPKIIFPEPKFTFDYKRLEKDFANIEKVTPEWIEDNPESVNNILAIAGCKKGYAKENFESYEAQANIINCLVINNKLKNKDKFMEMARKQFAKEKKEYVDSVIDYVGHTDKELVIKGLNAVEKYGTAEHCDKLGILMGEKDEEIIRPLVRAIAASSDNPTDTLFVTSFLKIPGRKYKSETLVEISKATGVIGRRKDAEILKPLLNHEDQMVKETAKVAIENIQKRSVK